MDIVNTIFNIIMNIVFILIQLILAPIDLLLFTAFPDFTAGLNSIASFVTLIGSSIGWAISVTGIPFAGISLIATFMILKLTVPLQIWAMKLGLKWYRTLKG